MKRVEEGLEIGGQP